MDRWRTHAHVRGACMHTFSLTNTCTMLFILSNAARWLPAEPPKNNREARSPQASCSAVVMYRPNDSFAKASLVACSCCWMPACQRMHVCAWSSSKRAGKRQRQSQRDNRTIERTTESEGQRDRDSDHGASVSSCDVSGRDRGQGRSRTHMEAAEMQAEKKGRGPGGSL